MAVAITADGIVADAARQPGVEGFEDGSFREGLDVLCETLPRGGATQQGLATIRRMMVDALACRFATEDYLAAHPSLRDRPIVKPVFVCGLPRTGTTLTVNLLSQDPTRRAPLKWELSDPMPPAEAGMLRSDPRCLEKMAVQRRRVAAGELQTNVHFEWSDEPTECVFIHAQDFKSMSWEAFLPQPDYLDFILGCDMAPTYRWHKKLLQALQAHNGGTWLLKAPSHALFCRGLLDVYPDARIIWTHRNPLTALASHLSLNEGVHRRFRDTADLAWLRRGLPRQLAEHVGRLGALSAEQPGRVYDLDYEAMMADPIGSVRALYAWLGDDFTPAVEQRMADWLARHPQGKHGGHRYSLADYGIDPASAREAFGDYMKRFEMLEGTR